MPEHRKRIVKAKERTLYDVISSTGELVGTHEDAGVADAEAARLDIEARGHWQQAANRELLPAVEHRVDRRIVMATDDPDDTAPMLTGPIVSDGEITTANLERGEKSPEPVQMPS